MQVFTVYAEQLKGRIDPLFYSKSTFNILSHFLFDTVPLADVTRYLKTGFAAGKQDQAEDNTGIIQIRPTNIDIDGNLYFERNVYISEHSKKAATNILQKGEVLFNNTNSQELVGKTAYFDLEGRYFCSNHITRIGVDISKLLPQYLQFILNFYQRRGLFFNICTNWNNQSGVNIELLRTIQIPLPDIPVQETIITIITSASEKKHQKEQEAQSLLDSIDTYVLEALGIQIPEVEDNNCFIVYKDNLNGRFDPFSHKPEFTDFYKYLAQIRSVDFVKFGSIIQSIINGLDYRIFTDEGINYLRVSNIKPNGIDFSEVEKIVVPDAAKNIDLLRGDILLTRKGTFGVATVLDADLTDIISSEIFRIRLRSEDIIPNYVGIILNSSLCQKQFLSKKVGAIMGSLTQDAVKEILIPIPSIDIQNKIVVEVENRRVQGKKLQQEAQEELEEAKRQVEDLLLTS